MSFKDDNLPMDNEEYNATMISMVNDINGFVYQGYSLDAIIHTIQWLRENPNQADFLIYFTE